MDVLKLLSESFFAQAKQLLFLRATQHSMLIKEKGLFFALLWRLLWRCQPVKPSQAHLSTGGTFYQGL